MDALTWEARRSRAHGFIEGVYRGNLSAQDGIGAGFPRHYTAACREARRDLPVDAEFERYLAAVEAKRLNDHDRGVDYATNHGGDAA